VKGLTIPDVISTDEDIELADRLIFWNEKKGRPRLRGRAVPPRSSDDEESDEDSFPSDGDGIFHSQSQNAEVTLKIWDQDKILAAQQKLQKELAKTTEYTVNEIIQVQREMLNLSIGDPATLQFVMQRQKQLLSDVRQSLAEQELEEAGGAKQNLAWPVTGRKSDRRKHERRKQSTDPGVRYASLSRK
jgi:small-conductance mechanosensitive channel